MKANNIKTKVLKSVVPSDIHDTFLAKAEKKYGNKRSGTTVLRKLIIKFNKGEIDI